MRKYRKIPHELFHWGCPRVERRIVCNSCSYLMSEARFATEDEYAESLGRAIIHDHALVLVDGDPKHECTGPLVPSTPTRDPISVRTRGSASGRLQSNRDSLDDLFQF